MQAGKTMLNGPATMVMVYETAVDIELCSTLELLKWK
jgi:hypothetical protein